MQWTDDNTEPLNAATPPSNSHSKQFKQNAKISILLMNNLTGAYNLKNYIVDPIKKSLDKKLESYRYYNICKEDELTTNNNGVDIISHQLELKFKSNNPIFISWATINDWFQYSLCVSETSFCNGVETFVKQDNNWKNIVGTKLKSFQVYGYPENIITSTETNSGKTTIEAYYLEPHLLILEFESEDVVGVANFYLEDYFEPKLAMGDDIWIIFGLDYINSFIKSLSLEKLYD